MVRLSRPLAALLLALAGASGAPPGAAPAMAQTLPTDCEQRDTPAVALAERLLPVILGGDFAAQSQAIDPLWASTVPAATRRASMVGLYTVGARSNGLRRLRTCAVGRTRRPHHHGRHDARRSCRGAAESG